MISGAKLQNNIEQLCISTMPNVKPDGALLLSMRKGIPLITYNNIEYKLLGRGGEANVYTVSPEVAIKVYRYPVDPDALFRELFITDALRSIDGLEDHIVRFVSDPVTDPDTSITYMLMELYDGDLDSWANLKINHTDDEWLSMLFQVTYSFLTMNNAGVLHGDPKPKNVFYKKSTSSIIHTVTVDGTEFSIRSAYNFVIGDFSRARLAEFDPDISSALLAGSSGTLDLYADLVNRSDLYELSKIIHRSMVNILSRHYSHTQISDIVESHYKTDISFKQRIDDVRTDLKSVVLGGSQDSAAKIKQKMEYRAYLYELIEAGRITIDDVKKLDKSVVFPSNTVIDILGRLTNPAETLKTMFFFFIQPA